MLLLTLTHKGHALVTLRATEQGVTTLNGDSTWLDAYAPHSARLGRVVMRDAEPEEWLRAVADAYSDHKMISATLYEPKAPAPAVASAVDSATPDNAQPSPPPPPQSVGGQRGPLGSKITPTRHATIRRANRRPERARTGRLAYFLTLLAVTVIGVAIGYLAVSSLVLAHKTHATRRQPIASSANTRLRTSTLAAIDAAHACKKPACAASHLQVAVRDLQRLAAALPAQRCVPVRSVYGTLAATIGRLVRTVRQGTRPRAAFRHRMRELGVAAGETLSSPPRAPC